MKGSIKHLEFNGMLISAGEFGNINYGYTGKAMGFSDKEIYSAGGIIHQATLFLKEKELNLKFYSTYFDEPEDHKMIKYGINLYYADRGIYLS